MNVIVCVDEQNGMAFNNRRQSTDRRLDAAILEWAATSRLWFSPYSRRLFGAQTFLASHADFLQKAAADEWVFSERDDVSAVLPEAQTVVLYRWDRHYPADLKFPMELLLTTHQLTSTRHFRGFSHAQITEEVYTRCV